MPTRQDLATCRTLCGREPLELGRSLGEGLCREGAQGRRNAFTPTNTSLPK